MDKKLLYGLAIGFTAFFLFDRAGKKKCGCSEKNEEQELLEPNPPNMPSRKEEDMSCEEAVDLIIRERVKVARLSEQQIANMRKKEMIICQNSK